MGLGFVSLLLVEEVFNDLAYNYIFGDSGWLKM